MNKNNELLEGNLFKVFIKYLFPSIGGMLGVSLYILFDTMFVGHGIGREGLAALNIAIPIYNVLTALGLLLGIGGATALSVSLGKGKIKEARKIFTHALFVSAFLGIAITIFGLMFIDKISYFMGASDKNIILVKDYLKVIITFSPAFVIVSTLTVFIRNDRAPKLAMWSIIIGSAVNIVLDALFILVFGLGMKGAAMATAVSPIVSLILLSIHFIGNENRILKVIKTSFQKEVFYRILKNGIPSFVIEISAGVVIFAFNNVLQNMGGTLGVSAYSIVANVSLICAAIFNGIAQAIQPIVSINYGAGNYHRVIKVLKFSMISSLIIGITFFAFGILYPEGIILFFNKDVELMNITKTAIRIYFLAFIFMGVNISISSYMQSMEHSMQSTAISVLRGIIFNMIFLIILSRLFLIKGVWMTVPLVEFITMFISLFYVVGINNDLIRNLSVSKS